jgi:uncharacterized repeat protein (TIGR04138 family)
MIDPTYAIAQIVAEDRRYSFEAYLFLLDALGYAQNVLDMGEESASEPLPDAAEEAEEGEAKRHVTGQQLCEAIRRYALDRYGYLAKTVLNSWGLHTTKDFGEIVFNMIRGKLMRKTPADTLVDFDNIYDFDVAFKQQFKIGIGDWKA